MTLEEFKSTAIEIPDAITGDALVQSAKTSILGMIVQVMNRGYGIVTGKSFSGIENCSELRLIICIALEVLLSETVTQKELEDALGATNKTEKENRICEGLIKVKESIEIQIKVVTVMRMNQLIVKDGPVFDKKSLMINEEPIKVILTGIINERPEEEKAVVKAMISDFGFFWKDVWFNQKRTNTDQVRCWLSGGVYDFCWYAHLTCSWGNLAFWSRTSFFPVYQSNSC